MFRNTPVSRPTRRDSVPNIEEDYSVEVQLKSVITCPHCGYEKEEEMPVDACQFFYVCEQCNTLLKPNPGDCCVFCSYGSHDCPPVQQSRPCC